MKRVFVLLTLTITIITIPPIVVAQGMTDSQSEVSSDGHTAREEAEGKDIWEKLQGKQLECKSLTDDNFESLGEYFMGRMMGSSHEAMNIMMERMMGKQGEEQMHVVMGKRMSGCDTSASGVGIMPMMGMMGSAFAPESYGGTKGGGNSMMGGWGGIGILGWLSMLVFWALLILGVVALIRYLSKSGSSKQDKTPLDILKERYAKGEIDKKEFEGKKKDLL